MRTKTYFYCSICNQQNYYSSKNKVKGQTKMTLKKFCKNCRKITLHNEKSK